jgi:hypothetical protein
MEISVKELFDLFISRLGHKAIASTQEKWRNSPEGWEMSALGHMKYWVLRQGKRI